MKISNCYFRSKEIIMSNYLGWYLKNFPLKAKLGDIKREPLIIVSMTSFTPRLNTLYISLGSLFTQSMKPDKIILYLGDDVDFEKLPTTLLHYLDLGLEIRRVDNLKSHKKYYYVMQEYPDDIIITVDDDLIYHKNMIKKLYKSYQNHPNCISAMRTHEIVYHDDGVPKPYAEWTKNSRKYSKPVENLFFTSGAGTLFPPHTLDARVFDKSKFVGLCMSADDVWLNAMAYLKNTGIVNIQLTEGERKLIRVNNTQEFALKHVNLYDDGNDRCVANLVNEYGALMKK